MIITNGLKYQYPGKSEMRFPDILCHNNDHALILGPSGAGKTTLLHLLGGLISPSGGEMLMNGTPVHALRGKYLDHFRGRHIGIVFQKPHFIRSITAIENLMLTQTLAGKKKDKARALHLLEHLSIAHKANDKTSALSIGEQQRLAIARAIINQPGLILADEPSSALDDQNCMQMILLLKQAAKEENANLIIVTHDSRITDMFDHQINLA